MVKPKITTSAEILAVIQQKAEKRWGDDWIRFLTREYARVESEMVGEEIDPNKRRSQIVRAFKNGACTLSTAILLAHCVDGRFQLAFTQVEEF